METRVGRPKEIAVLRGLTPGAIATLGKRYRQYRQLRHARSAVSQIMNDLEEKKRFFMRRGEEFPKEMQIERKDFEIDVYDVVFRETVEA